MRDLNGFFKKILLISSIFLLPFSFSNKVHAANSFKVYSDFHHVWSGTTINSTIYLTITSEKESTLLTYYTITIPDENISPKIFSINRNETLEPTIHRRSGASDIVIDLKNTPISPKKPVTLKITYSMKNSSNDLVLISSVNDTTTRKFTFTYPTYKGDVTWSSAPVQSIRQIANNTEVVTAIPNTTTVKVILGQGVIYKYTIDRNLVNTGDEMILSEISLPLNNSRQHILIEDIEPTPEKAYKDIDGNYILQYSIAPQSNMDVSVNGYILMKKSTYPFQSSYSIEKNPIWKITEVSLIRNINRYIQEYGLDISDTFSDIEELDNEKKEILYKSIYQYVVENLKPNTFTLGSLTGSERLTSQEVLLKQTNSTSEAYADAIISIYRQYGIPSRLVIGYVSNISNYNPDGMYHYWAEYFDNEKNDWIPVDPFLEDYSSTSLWKRDMHDHISLIYRYSNPNTPKLSYFTENDFKIEKVNDTPEVIHDFDLDFIFEPYKISNPYLKGSIGITNIGNTILDLFTISKSNPDLTKYIDYIENNSQNILLPNQSHQIKFNIPSKDIEEEIFAVVNALSGTQKIEDKLVEDSIEVVEDNRNLDILTKLVSVTIFLFFLIPLYFISKRVKIKNG